MNIEGFSVKLLIHWINRQIRRQEKNNIGPNLISPIVYRRAGGAAHPWASARSVRKACRIWRGRGPSGRARRGWAGPCCRRGRPTREGAAHAVNWHGRAARSRTAARSRGRRGCNGAGLGAAADGAGDGETGRGGRDRPDPRPEDELRPDPSRGRRLLLERRRRSPTELEGERDREAGRGEMERDGEGNATWQGASGGGTRLRRRRAAAGGASGGGEANEQLGRGRLGRLGPRWAWRAWDGPGGAGTMGRGAGRRREAAWRPLIGRGGGGGDVGPLVGWEVVAAAPSGGRRLGGAEMEVGGGGDPEEDGVLLRLGLGKG